MLVLVDSYTEVLFSRSLDEVDLTLLKMAKSGEVYLNTLPQVVDYESLRHDTAVRRLRSYGYVVCDGAAIRITGDGVNALQYNDMLGYVSEISTAATFGLTTTRSANTVLEVMGFAGTHLGSYQLPPDCRITQEVLNALVPTGEVALSHDHKALLNFIHQWND